MSYRLIIKPEAESDMFKIAKWYEEKKEGLGSEFLEELEKLFIQIKEKPMVYQIRYRKVRFGLIHRFQYAVHFTLEADKIFVLAVLGSAQDPNLWR